MCTQLFYLFVFLLVFHWACRFVSRKLRLDIKGKSVLITGCDSGFGKALTIQLAGKGITVFAACLTEAGKKDLDTVKNVDAFLLDVTSPQSIKDGLAYVSGKAKQGLWGVVNNAGVLRGGYLEVTPIRDLQLQLTVNVVGMASISQAFTPLLRAGKGRLVNISSVSGRFGWPGTSGYTASKYAVQGLSDCLRRELAMWGIKVIIIEPGAVKTGIWAVPFNKQQLMDSLKDLPKETLDLYVVDFFEKSLENSKKAIDMFENDPQLITDILDESLTARFPLTRYSVGKEIPLWWFLAYTPTWLSDFLISLDPGRVLPAALGKSKSK